MKMLNRTLITALIACMTASAAFPETQVVKQLKACGSQAKNSFGTHIEHPATNEGAGYVGFATEDTDATGTKERFTLVNCATRKVVQLKAEYLLTDSSKGLPPQGDLFAFVETLSKQNKLANEALFTATAKAQGFAPIPGSLPPKWSEKGKRSDCGCQLYYPETM
jgi:hypothetical protein